MTDVDDSPERRVAALTASAGQLANRFATAVAEAKIEDGPQRLALWQRIENRKSTHRQSVSSKAQPTAAFATPSTDLPAKFDKPTHDEIVHFFKTSGRVQHAGMTDNGQVCIHILLMPSVRLNPRSTAN